MFDIVTGGCGFIGSHLVDRLIADGRKVRVIDNLSTGRMENIKQHQGNPAVKITIADISGLIDGAFDGASRVFHLAALADIVPSIERPEDYYRANVTGTFNVMMEAKRAGVKKVIYAASSSCYGIAETYPTPEHEPMEPEYPYALFKKIGEDIALNFGQYYRIPVISLRLFNVYGRRSRTSGAYGAMFGTFMAQLRAGEPLTIVGDGTQMRDFIHVSDVVDAFCAAADSRHTGTFNIGSGVPVSIREIVSLLGAKQTVNIPDRPGEPFKTCADLSSTWHRLGWQRKVSMRDGVKEMLAHIDDWKDAPVWTPETIAEATRAWFKHLG